MHVFQRGAACAMLIVCAASARAQGGPERPFDPPPPVAVEAMAPFVGINVALDVAEDESKASASVSGFAVRNRNLDNDPAKDRTDITWSLGIAVPVGGGDDLLDRASLEKLSNGTKISAGLNFLSYNFKPVEDWLPSARFDELMAVARRECLAAAKTDEDKAYCKDAMNSEDFVREHAPWLRLAANRAAYSGYWSYGIAGSVSFNKFTYYEAATLKELEASPSGYSASVNVAYFPADAVSAWKGEAEYSSAPEAADDAVNCKPVVIDPAEDCEYGAPSAPTREKSFVLRAKYLRYFPFRSGKAGIGAAIVGSKDTMSSDYGVELPVYVTIPGVSVVAPGVKFGYGSKDGETDFTASVFLKTSFSFK